MSAIFFPGVKADIPLYKKEWFCNPRNHSFLPMASNKTAVTIQLGQTAARAI